MQAFFLKNNLYFLFNLMIRTKPTQFLLVWFDLDLIKNFKKIKPNQLKIIGSDLVLPQIQI